MDEFRVVGTTDGAQCTTHLSYWDGLESPCRNAAVALVLCGCLGEVIVWGRKCEVCLGHLEAGLHAGRWGWPHLCREVVHGTPVVPTVTLPMRAEGGGGGRELFTGRVSRLLEAPGAGGREGEV